MKELHFRPYLLLLCLVLACTTVEDPGGPSTGDALVGSTNPMNPRPGFPNGFDRGLPGPGPRFDMMVGSCSPNTRLGLCSECGPNGVPRTAVDDNNCPPFNCGGLNQYEKVIEEDYVICYQTMGQPQLNGRCIEQGRCATEEEFCAGVSRVEIDRAVIDPCNEMLGCTGTEPPTFNTLDEGTPCNQSGVCEPSRLGGTECSVFIPSACRFGMSRNAKFFCESGEEFGMDFCEFFVEVPGGGRTVCEDFCAELG